MFHALHAFSRHPALFPLANALIPSMSQTPTRYAKNAAVSAVNAPGPMYLAPSALCPKKRLSITPQPISVHPHVLPVSQMTSLVNSARGTMSAFPVIARSADRIDRPSSVCGLAKLLASCATGMDMKSSVAVQPLSAPHADATAGGSLPR